MVTRLRMIGLLSILFISLQPQAFGWGNVGHQSVGILAENLLTETTRNRVRQILNGNTLSGVSVWADSVRRQQPWRHTSWYHFTKTAEGITYVESLRGFTQSERNKGDAVLAMVKAEQVLRDPSSSATDQRYALNFLVHFVGDAHQPFHSGRGEDQGGNLVSVNWMGSRTNLHSVWDVKILHSTYTQFEQQSPELSARDYVQMIDHVSPAQKSQWLTGYFDSWLEESVVARVNPYSGYDRDQELYRRTYIDVVDRRILQAGYRLGALLNSIYDPQAQDVIAGVASSAQAFHTSARNILGAQYMDKIVLRPTSRMTEKEAKHVAQIKEFAPDCPEHSHD